VFIRVVPHLTVKYRVDKFTYTLLILFPYAHKEISFRSLPICTYTYVVHIYIMNVYIEISKLSYILIDKTHIVIHIIQLHIHTNMKYAQQGFLESF